MSCVFVGYVKVMFFACSLNLNCIRTLSFHFFQSSVEPKAPKLNMNYGPTRGSNETTNKCQTFRDAPYSMEPPNDTYNDDTKPTRNVNKTKTEEKQCDSKMNKLPATVVNDNKVERDPNSGLRILSSVTESDMNQNESECTYQPLAIGSYMEKFEIIPTGHENETFLSDVKFSKLLRFGLDVGGEQVWMQRAVQGHLYFHENNYNGKIRMTVRAEHQKTYKLRLNHYVPSCDESEFIVRRRNNNIDKPNTSKRRRLIELEFDENDNIINLDQLESDDDDDNVNDNSGFQLGDEQIDSNAKDEKCQIFEWMAFDSSVEARLNWYAPPDGEHKITHWAILFEINENESIENEKKKELYKSSNDNSNSNSSNSSNSINSNDSCGKNDSDIEKFEHYFKFGSAKNRRCNMKQDYVNYIQNNQENNETMQTDKEKNLKFILSLKSICGINVLMQIPLFKNIFEIVLQYSEQYMVVCHACKKDEYLDDIYNTMVYENTTHKWYHETQCAQKCSICLQYSLNQEIKLLSYNYNGTICKMGCLRNACVSKCDGCQQYVPQQCYFHSSTRCIACESQINIQM